VGTPFSEPVGDSVAKVNHEIAVGEDLAFQRSWWRFERGVWIFFLLLIALDLSGAFGRGPLANASMQTPDNALAVHYERVERTGTPSMLTIQLGPRAIHDGAARVFVSESIVASLGARRVIPEPATTQIGGGGLTYTFPATTLPASVRLELEPAGAGLFPFSVSVPGLAQLRGRILVMP
jgi:hypothetical protein